MRADQDHELREQIVALIREMDADTLGRLHDFISGLEATNTSRKDERVESE